MSAFTLRYTRILPNAPTRPLVRMRLLTPDSSRGVVCTACLDTGTDRCVFPLSFARQLGLDPAQMLKAETRGATGSGDVYYSDVRILIPLGGHVFALAVRAGFMEGLDALGMGLLGQTGFFDRFRVTFDRPRGTFTIHDPRTRGDLR